MLLSEYTWPMKNKDHKPFKHQVDTTTMVLNNKRAFVLNEMGTGKTLSMLWATDFLFENQKIKKVLIVSPLSTMIAVWRREIFLNFPRSSVAIAHGSRDQRIAAINSTARYVIINHDGVVVMEKELVKAGFDIVIIDELTAFKTANTNRTKAMCKVTNSARAVYGLTGDPIPNRHMEAFAQARVVNPFNPALPKYMTQFQQMVEYQVGPFTAIPTANADSHVHAILQPSVRFTRDDCLDLPEMLYNEIEIPFTQQQKDVYEELRKEMLYEYENGIITAVNAGVKLLKLMQVSAGAIRDSEGKILLLDDKPRMDYIEETLEEMGKNRKLILFSTFRASIEKLYNHFSKLKIKTAIINGDTPQNTRGELVRQFQDEDLELFILQPKSMSHGVTLTASNTVIWQSLNPSGETFQQANARISRIGQERKQYVGLPYSSPVELKMIKLLKNKEIQSSNVLELFKDI